MKTGSQECMYVQKHLTSIPFLFPKVYSTAVSSKHLMQNSNIHEFFWFIFWAPESSFPFSCIKQSFPLEIAEKEETGVKNRNGDKMDCREGRSISSDPWRLRGGEVVVPVGGRRIQVCLKGCAVTKDELGPWVSLLGRTFGKLNCSYIQIQVELHKIFCMYEVTFSLHSFLPILS